MFRSQGPRRPRTDCPCSQNTSPHVSHATAVISPMWSLRLVHTDDIHGESDERVSLCNPMGATLEIPTAEALHTYSHLYKLNLV